VSLRIGTLAVVQSFQQRSKAEQRRRLLQMQANSQYHSFSSMPREDIRNLDPCLHSTSPRVYEIVPAIFVLWNLRKLLPDIFHREKKPSRRWDYDVPPCTSVHFGVAEGILLCCCRRLVRMMVRSARRRRRSVMHWLHVMREGEFYNAGDRRPLCCRCYAWWLSSMQCSL
jgi:hypothetical protein